MRYYKILSESECHHGLQYHDGLVVDPVPFAETGSCVRGGIYFAREDILAFLCYGPWIREVTIPDDARVVENPGYGARKWRADRVVLGPRRRIDAETVRELIADGADVHACDDDALQWACAKGHAEIARVLLDAGADVHAYEDGALRWASMSGYTEIVRMLLDAGADIHARDDEPVRRASWYGHTETMWLLLDAGADVHARDDEPVRSASERGHTEIVEMLIKHVETGYHRR